jgi:hypothetical protein
MEREKPRIWLNPELRSLIKEAYEAIYGQVPEEIAKNLELRSSDKYYCSFCGGACCGIHQL